jgi:hypothetical protein
MHKSPRHVSTLCQIDQVHALQTDCFQIHFIIVIPPPTPHLRVGLPSCLFPSGSPTEMQFALLLSPIRATCSTSLILDGLITPIVFSEQYRTRNPSFRTCRCPSVSSLVGPSNFLSTLLGTLNLGSALSEDQTRDTIVVLCVFVLVFLNIKWKMTGSWRRTNSLNCSQDIMTNVSGGLNITAL